MTWQAVQYPVSEISHLPDDTRVGLMRRLLRRPEVRFVVLESWTFSPGIEYVATLVSLCPCSLSLDQKLYRVTYDLSALSEAQHDALAHTLMTRDDPVTGEPLMRIGWLYVLDGLADEARWRLHGRFDLLFIPPTEELQRVLLEVGVSLEIPYSRSAT